MNKEQPIGGITNLRDLLKCLRTNGVKTYETDAVKIEFSANAYLENPVQDNTNIITKENKSKQELEDELMYWSAKG